MLDPSKGKGLLNIDSQDSYGGVENRHGLKGPGIKSDTGEIFRVAQSVT